MEVLERIHRNFCKFALGLPVQPIHPPNYTNTTTGILHARSEVKRRENSIKLAEHLLSENHTLMTVIKQCLHNNPAQRPCTGADDKTA